MKNNPDRSPHQQIQNRDLDRKIEQGAIVVGSEEYWQAIAQMNTSDRRPSRTNYD